MTSTPDEAASAALTLLATFCTRILPGTVRRIASWKRLPRGALAELQAEVRQELAIDCLEHGALVVALSPAQRHARWMRLAERWIYRQHVSRRGAAMPHDAPAPPGACFPAAPLPEPEFVPLANGRTNLTATAARSGLRVKRLQRQLEQWARHLGCDAAHDAFWRARLAEALAGLGADLLRDRGQVRLLPRRRHAPDPEGRLQRLRRLSARFHVRPSTAPERSLLRRWLRQRDLDGKAPRRLLAAAATLAPHDAAAWLWLFEACLADGDVAAAAAAVRQCRRLAAPLPLADALARARLLEARGRLRAATALLHRAAARHPRHRTLALVAADVAAELSRR